MKTNRAAIDLIKVWEGSRLEAYPDPATGGEPWTIGYGHTSMAGPPKVYKGLKITPQEAADILVADLVQYEMAVTKGLKRNPTDNQFGAMVSLCYNIGPGNFAKSSVLKKFNAGDTTGAADAFRLWNKAAGKVMKGLVNRRESERALFLRPSLTEEYDDAQGHEPKDPTPDAPKADVTNPASAIAKGVIWFVGLIITAVMLFIGFGR